MADPDDLPQVFTVVESFSFDTLYRQTARMARSESGRRLLSEKPDIVEVLADREALARMPEGSLARAYLAFVERENISAAGIRSAASEGMTHIADMPAPLDWMHARMRDTHDLWHAATGYSGDIAGELGLLGFILAQVANPGIGLILVFAWLKSFELHGADGAELRRTILDGFQRGLRADSLAGQTWEELLALPVDEVRRRLRLDAPPVYHELRSSEFKASMASAA